MTFGEGNDNQELPRRNGEAEWGRKRVQDRGISTGSRPEALLVGSKRGVDRAIYDEAGPEGRCENHDPVKAFVPCPRTCGGSRRRHALLCVSKRLLGLECEEYGRGVEVAMTGSVKWPRRTAVWNRRRRVKVNEPSVICHRDYYACRWYYVCLIGPEWCLPSPASNSTC